MAISQALADIYLANPHNAFYMEALSIYHSAMAKPMHITNASVGFKGKASGKSENFVPVPFSIKLPDKDASGSQAMNIQISNLGLAIIDNVEQMARQPYEAVDVRFRVYIYNDLDADGDHKQQLIPAWRFDATAITATEDAISIVATKRNMHNRSWPRALYKPSQFPGINK